MRLAVDAMGGDHAPESIVKGCEKALEAYEDLHIIFVGDKEKITPLLTKNERVEIIHTDVVITGEDSPVRAVRRKKNSSLVLTVQQVKEGRADAAISAGNTGALMTAGLLVVGRMKGIERPALSPMLPTKNGDGFLLLDVGANMDAKPSHLIQYAYMGDVYMKKVRGIDNPRIGLLNVGSEAGKGTDLTKHVFARLSESSLNFVGNVEARELLDGAADVVICDGFSGNLVLKSIEGTALSLFSILKDELTSSLKNKLAAGVLKPSFKKVKEKMDYSEYGGAGLFGLQAPVIKAHGSSDEQAFFSAVKQAKIMYEQNVTETIKRAVELMPAQEEDYS
ncbi:phosphate acyltransferase PlsX [Salipaludibacillus agaradhaerens]|uniref:phosphate acyltransferase PlsX n=1 Tax=Salipaludibacillus agaradhaerens TaxID=76935 RepID=UPI002151FDD2|nr:phosphate acyltransferase PlsX [Salipaludibacillus agaradhaerens]MCR6107110.1 phosphate acyltransferase PlsX [Salipaludibacillus agaradhaerens]MCR6119141.1 phosphate acyltransferase PlsX [Salipaludibacillus agaradhaerens]UJW58189.1 phosphate acyltransferase PlsX [Bacillus sp. A116_S68]